MATHIKVISNKNILIHHFINHQNISTMKNLFFAVVALFIFAACSNENESPELKVNEPVEVTSDLSTQDFIDICSGIESTVASRSDDDLVITEAIARESLEPLVADGRHLQEQMMKQVTIDQLSAEELEYFANLSDEDCASLSFIYHTIIDNSEDEAIRITDNEYKYSYSISSDRLFHCAKEAIGYFSYEYLKVNGVINAKTVVKALWQIGKRYLGYISLAIAIYEFYGCIS